MSREEADRGAVTGTVLAVQANFYRVRLSATSSPPELLCTRRARLKKMGQQVIVGDRVVVEDPDWQGQRGAIAAVLPRQNQLDRPPIANVDQVLLVFALADPALDAYQLSRFLVAIESANLPVLVGLSKADLVSETDCQAWCRRLQRWGYSAHPLSVQQGSGVDDLRQQLQQHVTVLAGPSGVGKSSLINTLAPQWALRTGEISERWRRGKHTTRHVELFELPQGGLLADTPGFSQPAIVCSPDQLIQAFPEGRQQLATAHCQFKDCLHRDEPDCAVRGTWERYGDYLIFLEEVMAHHTHRQNTRNPEARTKNKQTRAGSAIAEPLLDRKRYRRTSRNTQQQRLKQVYEEGQAHKNGPDRA